MGVWSQTVEGLVFEIRSYSTDTSLALTHTYRGQKHHCRVVDHDDTKTAAEFCFVDVQYSTYTVLQLGVFVVICLLEKPANGLV